MPHSLFGCERSGGGQSLTGTARAILDAGGIVPFTKQRLGAHYGV